VRKGVSGFGEKIEKLQNRYVKQLETLAGKAQKDLVKLVSESLPEREEE
jgi:hypothetical protein